MRLDATGLLQVSLRNEQPDQGHEAQGRNVFGAASVCQIRRAGGVREGARHEDLPSGDAFSELALKLLGLHVPGVLLRLSDSERG